MSELKKFLLRKIMLIRQRNLPASYIEEASKNIQAQIFSSRLYQNAKKIFTYVSTPREPSTIEIIEQAIDSGKEIYVPKCGNKNMLAVRIYDLKNLFPRELGILEPENCSETLAANEFDLIIAPCLAASLDGQRLGHGAGYYDKFLAGSKNKNIICLCFQRMLYENIPMNNYDIFMPNVITEIFDFDFNFNNLKKKGSF